MKNITRLALSALFLSSVAATAQQPNNAGKSTSDTAATRADSGAKKEQPQKISLYRPAEINHIRPADQRGVNVFESPKENTVPFTGFALSFGGAFTQEFQGLAHQNAAAPVLAAGVNANQLITIGHGFNNAVANLNVNAQIAPGIRIAMTSYLSARHHQETWVKDGYLLIDDSPIDNALLKSIMKYTTLRVGHFEINYGDAHFRRSDNGNSMYNPFAANYILDDFTTEIGSEVYLRSNGLIAMLGATGGEVHGQVTAPQARSMSVLGKLGFDKSVLDDFIRVRLTGSFYANNKAASNTLFTGDRGGSAYYDVLENTASTETANAWSGQVRPGFSNKINAEVVNPFVKIGGAEFFGNFETATGGSFAEPKLRTIHQNVYEGLYRLGGDKFYVGGRYNTLKGQLISKSSLDENVTRYQVGGGWFVTPNVLAKLEWVNQKYNDFPLTDIRYGGQFKGFMVQGSVGF
ncbi:MAG TPA: hypothetical protein VK636_20495 [Gemmatimonadaceae bacterium]|nr:hypothetical protein [Gemmatimonadaceae bacterium]